jgi:quinol monooxygenase YgiN
MTSSTVSFVVYLPTRPEARERMRAMMFAVLDEMAKEPDFVRTWAHEDMDDPDLIVNYETWACSREYFIAHHLKKPYRAAYEAALPVLLSGERRIMFLTTIRAYPG